MKAASAGVASASMPGVKEWITAVFDDFGVERSEVVGDEVIALDGAFKGGPGILQIAGTGSNCIGRAPDGGRESAGGWSSRLGDEGSGYWIGLHAVRRALKALDREEPTRILEVVGGIWGTKTIDELVNLGDSTPGPDFAALAPAISELAEEGDAVALGVLKQAAADLVDSVLLVRAKLRRKHNLTAGSSGGVDRQRDREVAAGARAVLCGIACRLRRRCRFAKRKLRELKARSGVRSSWRRQRD